MFKRRTYTILTGKILRINANERTSYTSVIKIQRERERDLEIIRGPHTLEALALLLDLTKLLLGGPNVGWDSPSDDGKTGVPGGVRSLTT